MNTYCYEVLKMPQLKDLRRSTNNKIIAGVCAGLADWLGWNVTTMRILFVVGSVLPIVPGFLVYAFLWVVVPRR